MVVTLGIIAAGFSGCGDDDDDNTTNDGGVSGKGGSGGKSGSGGKAGTSGKGGAGGKSGAGGSAGKGGAGGRGGAGGSTSSDDAGVADAIDSKAADLRVTLNLALGEHLIFAAKTTNAALGGRTSEYMQWNTKLKTNGTDVGAMVKAAFGDAAETAFNKVWADHNTWFNDYAGALSTDDTDAAAAALDKLNTMYVPQFATLLNSATMLPMATLTSLTKAHVDTTKAVIDAQQKKDWAAAYSAIRTAFKHMQMIGDPLAIAIAKNDQTKFPGDANNKQADFRVALNQLLQEHLYLATFATGAYLGDRTGEYNEAKNALDKNGDEIGAAVGDIYDQASEDAFNKIWDDHNTWFEEYTVAVKDNNTDGKNAALDKLTKMYVPMFTDLLNSATNLDKTTLSGLIMDHVAQTGAVVDAQKTGNWEDATSKDRTAGQHMQMLADPLASGIVASKPDKFE